MLRGKKWALYVNMSDVSENVIQQKMYVDTIFLREDCCQKEDMKQNYIFTMWKRYFPSKQKKKWKPSMPRKENQKEQIFWYTITTQNVKLCEKTKQISMERNFEFWGTIWSHGTCSGVNLLHTVPILWKMHLWKMLRMSQDCCGIDWSATFTCKITLVIEDYMIYSLKDKSSWNKITWARKCLAIWKKKLTNYIANLETTKLTIGT